MMMLRLIGSILLLGFALFGCNSDPDTSRNSESSSPRIVKKTKLLAPKKNTHFILGEKIAFEVESKVPVDSIVVQQGSESSTVFELSFEWTSRQPKVGKQKVRITTYFEGKSETHYGRYIYLSDQEPTDHSFAIVNEYPHNPSSFIQGLFFFEDTLFESTGQNGESQLMKINHRTGEIYQTKQLDSKYFGEGSTIWNDQIFYLTYTTQVGFKYDRAFNELGSFQYPHQGWGITTMGDTLLVSDGSEVIRIIDPRDFSEIGQIEVYDHEGAYDEVNELEYYEGIIYANVWFKDFIVGIDPKTGKVLKKIDLTGLLDKKKYRNADVLNGIAFDPTTGNALVTGKLWPSLFELKFTNN